MKHMMHKARSERATGGKTPRKMKVEAVNEPNDPQGEFDKDDAADLDQTYTAGKSKVVEAARERKRGGSCMKKGGMAVEGKKAKDRMDRPARKRGGKVGSEKSPLTEAARTSDRPNADIQSKDGMD